MRRHRAGEGINWRATGMGHWGAVVRAYRSRRRSKPETERTRRRSTDAALLRGLPTAGVYCKGCVAIEFPNFFHRTRWTRNTKKNGESQTQSSTQIRTRMIIHLYYMGFLGCTFSFFTVTCFRLCDIERKSSNFYTLL